MLAQNIEGAKNQFFVELKEGHPDIALDKLYESTPWLSEVEDDIKYLKIHFTNLWNILGKYHGYELLAKEEVANCYIVYEYLLKFDRQPIRIKLKFYKPDTVWHFYSFAFDDQFVKDIDKVIKLKYLKSKTVDRLGN
jgi:hypothetical protein